MNHHVARVVVWGKHADTILSSQPWNYAFGIDSPLDRFLTFDGKIILLGSDHDAITLLHYIEHIADFPNKRIAHYEVPVIEHGRRVWRAMEEVDTSSEGTQANWPDRFFAKIIDSFLIRTNNNGARVGPAETYILNARALLDFALPIMQAVAADPMAAENLYERTSLSNPEKD